MAIHSVQSRFGAASFLKHSDGTYDFDFQDSMLHLRLLGRLSNSNSLNLVTGMAIQTIHIDELVQGMVMWCDL